MGPCCGTCLQRVRVQVFIQGYPGKRLASRRSRSSSSSSSSSSRLSSSHSGHHAAKQQPQRQPQQQPQHHLEFHVEANARGKMRLGNAIQGFQEQLQSSTRSNHQSARSDVRAFYSLHLFKPKRRSRDSTRTCTSISTAAAPAKPKRRPTAALQLHGRLIITLSQTPKC